MAAQEHTGTQTATVTTEHTLVTSTVAKTLKLYVNVGALVADEYVELKQKRKVLTGDSTQVITESAIFSWLDGDLTPVVSLPAMLNGVGSAVFTLKQLNGTSRDFPWAVESA
jgi:hypothetical protein